jgi:hypothetical protein
LSYHFTLPTGISHSFANEEYIVTVAMRAKEIISNGTHQEQPWQYRELLDYFQCISAFIRVFFTHGISTLYHRDA